MEKHPTFWLMMQQYIDKSSRVTRVICSSTAANATFVIQCYFEHETTI